MGDIIVYNYISKKEISAMSLMLLLKEEVI